jgi:hypothetical protein
LIFTLVASLCLVSAAGAGAKPGAKKGSHGGSTQGSPLVVDAPKAANLPIGIPTKVKVTVANHGKKPIAGVVLLASHSKEVKATPAKAKIGTLKPRKTAA